MAHDLFRHFDYVRQALSHNNKPIGFLLGAGCPLAVRTNHRSQLDTKEVVSDPLIPDVSGLTALIADALGSKEPSNPNEFDKLVQLLRDDGIANPNVEHLLTRVRALANVAGKGTVRGFREAELAALERGLCAAISEAVGRDLPDQSTPYHDLSIWTRSIERTHPVQVFTPNYDLLVEQALEETSTPYFDGFVGARRAFFDLGAIENERILPARWTRLWKIHGSINWRLDRNRNVVRGDPLRQGESYLIYPSHLKYEQSRKMPYLAMLDRLKDFLLKPSSIMFVCGYSFNDDNINDVIASALSANATAMTYVFLFGKLANEKYRSAVMCARTTPNLTLAAFDRAVIGREEATWSMDPERLEAVPRGVVAQSSATEGTGQAYELRLGCFATFGSLLRSLSSTEGLEPSE